MGNNNCHNKNLDEKCVKEHKKKCGEHFEFPRRLPEREDIFIEKHMDIFIDPNNGKVMPYEYNLMSPFLEDTFSSEGQKYIELIICHNDNNTYERYDTNGRKINECVHKKWKIKGLSPSYFNNMEMQGGQNTREEDITDEDLENSDENDTTGDTEELEVEEVSETVSSSESTNNSSETNSCSSVDKNGNCKNKQNKYSGNNPKNDSSEESETVSSNTGSSSVTNSCSSVDKNGNCKKKNKQNKYSGNNKSSSDISGLESDNETENGLPLNSDISSSELYKLQSRIFTSMTQSESGGDSVTDSEYTEQYYDLIKKIKEKQGKLYTSETKEILGMNSDENSTTNEFIRRTKFTNSKYS